MNFRQKLEEAQQAIAAVRKQCDEQIAVEQARSIQVKAEFERYKVEMDEKINEAAAQNLTLQDQIDDLQSKLDMLANAQRSSAPRPAAPKIETATGGGVPVFNISTPKAPVGADYVGGDEAVQELKTPARALKPSLLPATASLSCQCRVQGFTHRPNPSRHLQMIPRKVLVSNSNSNSLWVNQIS